MSGFWKISKKVSGNWTLFCVLFSQKRVEIRRSKGVCEIGILLANSKGTDGCLQNLSRINCQLLKNEEEETDECKKV